MDLKGVLPQKKEDKADYYWSLILEPGWIQAGIWQVKNRRASIVSESVPVAWNLDDELINVADTALSTAIQNLQKEIDEPTNTVFGVISSWVIDGKIADIYLGKIKKICDELSLKPVGFVILAEAIAHYYKSLDKSPFSGVVLGINKEKIETSVFRRGVLVGVEEVSKSISLIDDVVEGISRFSSEEPLPSKFVLYNGRKSELEEARQILLKADWDGIENTKLLHTPKIEIIDGTKKIHAVTLAGAADLIDAQHIYNESDSLQVPMPKDNTTIEAGETKVSENLGFVIGADVSKLPQEKLPETGEQPEVEHKMTTLSDQGSQQSFEKKKPVGLSRFKSRFKFTEKTFPAVFKKSPLSLKKSRLRENLISKKTIKKPYLFGGIFFLIVLVGLFLAWWFLPKANVTLYLSTKSLEEKIEIIVDPQSEVANISLRTLPGVLLETNVSSEKTKSTSGVKTIGEKATGEIVLYRAGSELNLKSGTEIIGPGNLKFSLDDDVKVASGSVTSLGTANAHVTAFDIGADYNFASDTSFSVSNYSSSDIEAKNQMAFSGGTSREISSVSENDIDSLEEDLLKELSENALRELSDSSLENKCKDCTVIRESFSSEILNREFDGKVGDEATSLKLSLSINASVLAVDEASLINLSKEILKDRVPENFILRGEQINIGFNFKGKEGEKYIFTADVRANLFPSIDPLFITEKIAGKYTSLARDFLMNDVPGFVRAEISFKPKLPGRLGTLPHIKKNIEVEIAAEQN